ncbi:MAG TPA: sensor histidine kinase [Syntrophobacteraceae bacterium]|nr:sensor histidine kinase [Syntrophobacteraceae bacterium]
MGFFKRLKIFPKFLFFLLPFLTFAIIVTSVVLSYVNYGFFNRSIHRDFSEILTASAGEIHQYMSSSMKGMESLAGVLAACKADSYVKEMALVAYQLSHPEFIALTLFTPEGEQMSSTRLVAASFPAAREEAFEKARKGEIGYTGTRFTRDNLPYACVATPLQSRGQVAAVLWGELSLKSVWNVLDRIRVGKTGRVYILDSAGRFVIHPDMDKVVRGESADPGIVGELANARDGPLQWYDESDGRRSYCLGATIADLDWLLVLTQDEGETYAYLYRNILWTVFVTLFICAMGPLVLWVPVKHLLGPIERMHEQALRIGKGHLDLRIEVGSLDEIGGLSSAINTMADSLKGFIHREVEMTKELLHSKNLATLGAAASKVTHEVGNLLNNISLIVLNLRAQRLSPETDESVQLLERESERVATFTKSFLQFAKKPELRLMKASIENTFHDIVALYSQEAELRGVRFEMESDPVLPMVHMDVGLMHQVLTNLVKNSLDAMSGPGVIRMEGSLEGEFLQLVVRDTGPGISPDVLEQIFNPFYTTKGRNGTGLGLSICKTILEAHHGSIKCSSEPGKFTAFILKLPLKQP